jgi:Josephin
MSVSIFHERQLDACCGLHCLNNLVQKSFFDVIVLATIAEELDRQEESLGMRVGLRSANVDESGNFSFNVLELALQRCPYPIHLASWSSKEDKDNDPTAQQAFVVNREDHWFTIRKIAHRWWNLNSLSDLPQPITDFYLTAFLGQLRQEGYSIFIAKGDLDGFAKYDSGKREGSYLPPNCTIHSERALLGIGSSTSTSAVPSAPAFVAFSGQGRRLVDKPVENPRVFDVDSNEFDEDVLLAQALSASLEDFEKSGQVTAPIPADDVASAKAKRRQQQLEALQKRNVR